MQIRRVANRLSRGFLLWGTAGVLTLAAPVEISGQSNGMSRRSAREIELAVEVLGLKPGDTIAEIGAGDARFSLRFAEVVGAGGRAYVNELGAARVRRIRERAERQNLTNVIAVEGAVDDTNLPDNCCDYVVMRHVYHMMTAPEPMANSFFRSLKPGGMLLIMEGDPQPGRSNAKGVPANRAGMGIDPQIVIDELSAAGFVFDRRVPDWVGSDYALLFRKPANTGQRDDERGRLRTAPSVLIVQSWSPWPPWSI